MGLYTGNLGNYYSNPSLEELGAYQFVSLEDIINNFRVAYVGEEKVINKAFGEAFDILLNSLVTSNDKNKINPTFINSEGCKFIK